MLIETGTCDACSLYSKGIRDSLKALYDGDAKGFGMSQFYLEKLIDYPVEKELQGPMSEICKTCDNYSVYEKDLLKKVKGVVDLADGLFSLLPPEDSTKILKISGELRDKLQGAFKEYFGSIEKTDK